MGNKSRGELTELTGIEEMEGLVSWIHHYLMFLFFQIIKYLFLFLTYTMFLYSALGLEGDQNLVILVCGTKLGYLNVI